MRDESDYPTRTYICNKYDFLILIVQDMVYYQPCVAYA